MMAPRGHSRPRDMGVNIFPKKAICSIMEGLRGQFFRVHFQFFLKKLSMPFSVGLRGSRGRK